MKSLFLDRAEIASGTFKVWQRNYMIFRKSKFSNLVWIWFEPILLYFSIGYGLGSFVPDMQGLSYAEFFLPSVLAMTSMMVSFIEASYGNFPKIHQSGVFSSMLTTSLDIDQIVIGEVLWAATKGALSAVGVALAAAMLGHITNFNYIFVLIVLFINGVFFGALGFYFAASIKNTDSLIIPTSLLLVPMSLLSGTYFSLDRAPFGLYYLSYLSPLTHSLKLIRQLVQYSSPLWVMVMHFLVILILAIVFLKFAIRRLKSELIN